jgi:hypothetical protein
MLVFLSCDTPTPPRRALQRSSRSGDNVEKNQHQRLGVDIKKKPWTINTKRRLVMADNEISSQPACGTRIHFGLKI